MENSHSLVFFTLLRYLFGVSQILYHRSEKEKKNSKKKSSRHHLSLINSTMSTKNKVTYPYVITIILMDYKQF